MDVKAAVLCGGVGSRLRPLTYYFQKTMLPVGKSQKPILEYVLKYLKAYGIQNATLLVGYKAEQIVNYFKNGESVEMRLDYSYDTDKLKGNGGALINAYKQGLFKGFENILIYYSDILTTLNIDELLRFHRKGNYQATLALTTHYKLPVGVAELKDDRVVNFVEKPEYKIHATIGILVLRADVLDAYRELNEGNVDIMSDIVGRLVNDRKPVGGYVSDEFWIDVGSTETYEKLDHEMIDFMFEKYMNTRVQGI